jgi:hypothetical protein
MEEQGKDDDRGGAEGNDGRFKVAVAKEDEGRWWRGSGRLPTADEVLDRVAAKFPRVQQRTRNAYIWYSFERCTRIP